MGNLTHFDVGMRRTIGGFKGFAGAVTGIYCHDECPDMVATCGIDRHVRLHRISDRKLLQKVRASFPRG
jgi:ribosome biogenesis protein NSA1